MQIIGTDVVRNFVSNSHLLRLSLAFVVVGGLGLPLSAQNGVIIPSLLGNKGLLSHYTGTSSPVLSSPTPSNLTPPEAPTEATLKTEDEDFEETIVTDRPDQTEAPPLTPKGWFQFEFGIQSEFDEVKDSKVKTQSTLYNTTLWKYGLTKSIELRLITEFGEDKVTFKNSNNEDTTTSVSGLNPITVGLKIPLQKEQGMVPDISLITHLELSRISAPMTLRQSL